MTIHKPKKWVPCLCQESLPILLYSIVVFGLVTLHQPAQSVQIAVDALEEDKGNMLSVTCVLNASWAMAIPLDHIEGSWGRDDDNGNSTDGPLEIVPLSSVTSQSSYVEIVRQTGRHSSTLAAFSLVEPFGNFSTELIGDVEYSLSLDEEILNVSLAMAKADVKASEHFDCVIETGEEEFRGRDQFPQIASKGVGSRRKGETDRLPTKDKDGEEGPPRIIKVFCLTRDPTLGLSVTLVCKFTSYTEPTKVVWKHSNGKEVNGDTNLKRERSSDSQWRARLYIRSLEQLGQYWCSVENEQGDDSKMFFLEVEPDVRLELINPGNSVQYTAAGKAVYNIEAGEDMSISLQCIAANMDASEFKLGYFSSEAEKQAETTISHEVQSLANSKSKQKVMLWSLKTRTLHRLPRQWIGDSPVSINTSLAGNSDARYVISVLNIKGIDYSLSGQLECSIPDHSIVYREHIYFSVVGKPVLSPTSLSIVSSLNATVTMRCEFKSNPEPLQAVWLYNNMELHSNDRYKTELLTQKKSYNLATPEYLFKLTISEVRPEDQGIYTCMATNTYGQTASVVQLDIDECSITPAPCDFRCTNMIGSYQCSCPDNFLLAPDGRSCNFSSPESTSSSNGRGQTFVPVLVSAVSVAGILLLAGLVVAYCLRLRRQKAFRDSILRTLHEHSKRSRNQASATFSNPMASSGQAVSREFPRERIKLLNIVGEGKFGQVWSAQALNIIGTGQWELVAVKMCKESASDVDKLDFLNEVALVSKIPRHLNVVNYLGCCTVLEPCLLIMEYITGGDLLIFLRKKRKFQLYDDPPSMNSENLPSSERAELRHTDTATWAKMAQQMNFINLSFEPDSFSTQETVASLEAGDNKQSDFVSIKNSDLAIQQEGKTQAKNVKENISDSNISATITSQDSVSFHTAAMLEVKGKVTSRDGLGAIALQNVVQTSCNLTLSKEDPATSNEKYESVFDQQNKTVKSAPQNNISLRQTLTDSTKSKNKSPESLNERDKNGPFAVRFYNSHEQVVDIDKKKECSYQEVESDDIVAVKNSTVRKSSDASSGNSQTAFLSSTSGGKKCFKRPRRRGSSFSLRRKTLTSDTVSVTSCSPALGRKLKNTRNKQQFACELSESGQGDVSSHTQSDDNEDHEDMVEDDNDEDINSGKLFAFALQIARGMRHLAENKIIHRDLAARNVLVTDKGVCKITDFGLARSMDDSDSYERNSKGALPIRWMSPEALTDGNHSSKSDVWAYGVLLWEIVTLGASPYPGLSARDVFRLVNSGRTMDRPDHCSAELYELMTECWSFLPVNRPDFAHVCCRLEELLEREEDYILLDQFQGDHYAYIDPDSLDEKL
ncbi:fibroblast growth factor receptor 1 [Plakobranchus ocellatus]|uniref:receptor protein-tyrosine kinase n=1 Tax=Plakobranchus ocellatus TaxID=259542 RepID=A0AAV3Z1P5_9GAST|nr:fibroblast growth factor receptor 1 [Plakobranchus ocellatus]